MYDSLFDITCFVKLDYAELTKKVFELQKEVEYLLLVKTELGENVTFLDA